MHPLIETHRDELKALALRFRVRSIKVFGSMARDDGDESSDVDLLVEAEPGTSGFVLGEMQMEAQDLLGRPVDLVTPAALHPLVRARVLDEARSL
ncbi:MAG: nucleotidyltransferase family protein [Azoarcus sp.]|uniref:Nucleotidyltransferase n=1 Tax=Pseudazoarcus pumilus TaxID=2067960 RepID=A0A2I6S3T5_9RHOO|nr:nucleotidyltransferase family protein [Pseudazoarcus pumilus]AUN93887.1 nucleotidyltransferase [Pseudazoarcus pumilus]MBA4741537.1 nucleotidyltransferase family protein [Azoarcus sp.]